ncbi:MAG: rRNA pseudouridine synthase [Prevotellaceae bacterium]|jgi:23S rRNA pseudouridine2605 synthase|nr:rRNA pseudouridine synthase [Prevotellaceae bacterium]
MNSKNPKKSYGRKPARTNNGAKNTRYAKKETGARASFRKPRRDDDDAGAGERPRYRKNDGEKRPSRFSRDSSDKPYRSRPRRDDAPGKKTGFKRNDNRHFEKSKRTYDAKPKAAKTAKAEKTIIEHPDKDTRLNKYIANSGICSRREADDYITAGLVSVNGKVVTELGVKVKSGDDVRFNGERLKGEMKVYVLLNKPKNFVTTTDDPHASKTVMDLIGDKCQQRVFPVGRLDKNTTGVLLLTNDGELCEQLTHPSYNKKKVYHASLNRNVRVSDLRKLIEGVELEDGLAQADEVAYVDGVKSEVGVEIHSGRNRVVRRMFEALSYQVQSLDRVYFAGLTKKNLKRGQWRFLSEKEVSVLRMGSYE